VLFVPYTKGSMKNGKKRFYSRLAHDEIISCGYKVLISVECAIIMIVELAVTSGLGSS
jgi:hypothetical protein